MKNPITGLTGPEFLAFYAIVIGVTLAFCWWRRRSGDRTHSLPPPDLPERLDPYEMAYLRGGTTELARVLTGRLVERGYLRIESRHAVRREDHPPLDQLSAMERDCFEWLGAGRRIRSAFASNELAQVLMSQTLLYYERLHAGRFLTGEEARMQAKWAAGLGTSVIAVIGGSRLAVGLIRGRPVGFLVGMAITGILAAVLISKPRRLTIRARQYIGAVQDKWNAGPSPEFAAGDSTWMMAALFGCGILSGTPYGDLDDASKKDDSAASFIGSGGSDGCAGDGGGDGGGGGCGGCGGGD